MIAYMMIMLAMMGLVTTIAIVVPLIVLITYVIERSKKDELDN